ncbi:WYL domain-containing protein [Alkalihalobacterium sp. APHAB7]|uniref:WYL domain-containing protein n=1 Tax=Alkalihalobacterium sp. APHAB7 TaxID=3402081 RepID=UPI003AAC306B
MPDPIVYHQSINSDYQLIKLHVDTILPFTNNEADIRQTDENTFIIKAKAKISDGLKGWILTWGSKVKVLSPPSLVEEIEVEIQKMLKHYLR